MRVVPTPDQLTEIETAFAFRYPPSFLAFLRTSTGVLFDALPAARLVASVEQVRAFHVKDTPQRERLPRKLIPFIVAPQPASEDVYCFDLRSPPPEYPVAAFAVHAVVEEWGSFSAWAAWVSHLAER